MLIDDYLKLYNEYTNKYGQLTVVFMQVGMFYEAYSLDNVTPNLSVLSDILNIQVTRRDKTKSDSPYMIGFPIQTQHKFIRLLIQRNYSVVLYRQNITTDDKALNRDLVERSLEAIYTPSTYLEEITTTTNFMCGIYIDSSSYQNNINYHCGISFIDISTGDLLYLEEHFNTVDALITYVINVNSEIRPKEYIIFETNDTGFPKTVIDTIINQINNCGKKITRIINTNKRIEKLAFQTEFLSRVYSRDLSVQSIIEQLDLQNYNFARVCIILTLDFCYQLNDRIINFIKKPKLHRNNTLILGNHAVQQLNILDNNSLSLLTNDYRSVYDVVNNCYTAMGKRLLYKRLTEPLIDPIIIQNYYNSSQSLVNIKKDVIKLLSNIKDIERLGRKIMTSSISPSEFYSFYCSLTLTAQIFELISNTDTISKLIETDFSETLDALNLFLQTIKDTIDVDQLQAYNSIKDIRTNVFRNNPELERLVTSLTTDQNIYETKAIEFAEMLNEKKTKPLEIKDTKDGKHLYTTLIRGDKIKKTLMQLDITSLDKYTFVMQNKTCKIFINNVGSTDYNAVQEQFVICIRKSYFEFLNGLSGYYSEFYNWANFVATIDFLINNLTLEERWGYCKPEIKIDSKIRAEALRHPIIERIISTEYIPNDIDLNTDPYILLFGINSSGKSSLQKSLGIALILAQSGCYVPANSFVYSPYQKLYVRITGSDNIFKGQSSFVVEMNELKSILENLGSTTLVISDEMARGSETTSSISIVAAAIIQLVDSKTNFISATHFNEILKFEEIKSLPLSIYHLSVEVSKSRSSDKNDIITYERRLKPGKCADSYGTLVANSIIRSNEFARLTERFSRYIQEEQQTLVSGRTSKYNSEVFVDCCIKCGSINNLHTHHIVEQQDCDKHKGKTKRNVQKNSKANLIVLCEECHQQVHRMNLEINKVSTTEGIKVTIK